MSDLQQLLDREAIERLKARYFESLDAKDWDAFRQVFTDDARFELMEGDPIEGADAFVEMTRGVLAAARTVHHGHSPSLTIDGPAEAHGSWLLLDYVEWPPDAETAERRGMEGYGRYDETYRKVDGEWRISGWALDYLRIDPLAPRPLPDQVLGGPDLLREGAYEDQVRRPLERTLGDAPPARHAPGAEPRLQELYDLEQIKELKARYFRLVDAQDWEAWREVFTDDVRVDLGDGNPIEGAGAFVAAVRGMVTGAVTVHHGHMPDLTIDSATEAHGTWALADYLEWPSGGMKGFGHERETYRKVDGAWRIASMDLSYLRVDPLPREVS